MKCFLRAVVFYSNSNLCNLIFLSGISDVKSILMAELVFPMMPSVVDHLSVYSPSLYSDPAASQYYRTTIPITCFL